MTQTDEPPAFSLLADEAGFDPIEDRLRANVRITIKAMFEEELAAFLGRLRYGRCDSPAKGYRHGHRERQLTGTFGTETVRVGIGCSPSPASILRSGDRPGRPTRSSG